MKCEICGTTARPVFVVIIGCWDRLACARYSPTPGTSCAERLRARLFRELVAR